MDRTRTIGQKWLANELDLPFLDTKKVYQRPIQSFNSFESYQQTNCTDRQADRQTDKQTDRHNRKNHFFGFREGGLKTWTFSKTGVITFFDKSNTFSLMRMRECKKWWHDHTFLTDFLKLLL